MITGRISRDIVSAPAASVVPSGRGISTPKITIASTTCPVNRATTASRPKRSNIRTKTVKPRIPYTIDGTPARFDRLMRMNRTNQVSRAYSSKYTAAPTPTGIAVRNVSRIIQVVPSRPAQIPASSGRWESKLVRNCQSRKPHDFQITLPTSTHKMPRLDHAADLQRKAKATSAGRTADLRVSDCLNSMLMMVVVGGCMPVGVVISGRPPGIDA
jgi:hypothetical protein